MRAAAPPPARPREAGPRRRPPWLGAAAAAAVRASDRAGKGEGDRVGAEEAVGKEGERRMD